MSVDAAELPLTRGGRRYYPRDRATRELLDRATIVQDVLLDEQRSWVAALPVDDHLRAVIFKRLCAVTGQLIDDLIVGRSPEG
jgi:hypothetical protein